MLSRVVLTAVVAVLVVSRQTRRDPSAAGPLPSSTYAGTVASTLSAAAAKESSTPSASELVFLPAVTETPSLDPLPTCCPIIPTPVAGETLAESDEFWNRWADEPHGVLVRNATSVEEDFQFVDLVVRGHITDVYIGEYWDMGLGPRVPLVYVQVAVSEVLKGTPVSRIPGFVEVGLGSDYPDAVEDMRTRLPQHDNVWFLVYSPNLRPRDPANESEIAPFEYLPTNDQQGVFRNIDEKVKVIRPELTAQTFGANHFPLPLQGTSFDALADQVRATADTLPPRSP